MRYQSQCCPRAFKMFCQIATGCSFHSCYDGSCRSFNASSSSPQWRVHFSVMKYVDVPVLFSGVEQRCDMQIYSTFRVFFGVAPFCGCGLVNDASDKCKYIVASSRLVSHWSALQAQPLNISRWSFSVWIHLSDFNEFENHSDFVFWRFQSCLETICSSIVLFFKINFFYTYLLLLIYKRVFFGYWNFDGDRIISIEVIKELTLRGIDFPTAPYSMQHKIYLRNITVEHTVL